MEKIKSQATCRLCSRSGTVYVTPLPTGEYKLRDNIMHKKGCPNGPKIKPKHFMHKKWERQEKKANELVGASETEASGARHKDGDGRRLFEWRVEAKQTASTQYRLKFSTWKELLFKCKTAGELPLLHIQVNKKKFCCVSKSWIENTIDCSTGNLSHKIRFDSKSFLVKEDINCPVCVSHSDGTEIVILTEKQFKEINNV